MKFRVELFLTRKLKSFFLVIFALIISTISWTNFASASQRLVLEDYFRGTTTAHGVFESRIAGVRREFTVKLTGTWDPRTFTLRLREDFVYDDGEKDTKVWFFQKVADDRYIGQRSDVLTPVNIGYQGDSIVFTYPVEVPLKNGSVALRFYDTLTQTGPRTVRNTATVMKYGITVGTVDLTFTK